MKEDERIYEYASNVTDNIFASFFFIWGLFIPVVLISLLVNPYAWRMMMDGNITFSIGNAIKNSFLFALIVSLLATIPAYFLGFNYDDINCSFPIWQFWNWFSEDESCTKRRAAFGNIVVATGLIFLTLYYIFSYYQIHGSFGISFSKSTPPVTV